MNELHRDPITGRWVITLADKVPAPGEFSVEPVTKKREGCPFCYGSEAMTPPEIVAHRPSGPADSPGWSVRVVPNKFPALKIEGELDKKGLGVFDMMNGVGAHEVIIDTPDHFRDLADLSYAETEEVIWTYKARSEDLRRDRRFKYILIFRNYGKAAGASLEHPHSQLIALPIVPKRVVEELNGAEQYYGYKERCVFCDILRQEKDDRERIVVENDAFLAFCPFMSRFPYEVWVLPRRHMSEFTAIGRDDVPPLARTLKDSLARIKALLGDPPYNFIIHTSPINGHERADYHWHIEIMPKLARIAGFEWGSGFYINPVPPAVAAKNLREAK